jgi:hypothetical protein
VTERCFAGRARLSPQKASPRRYSLGAHQDGQAGGKPGQWRVACSCGFEREATTAWEATEIAKLHVQRISGVSRENPTWTITRPPFNRA